MDSLIVRGLSRGQISRGLAAGTLIKITRGLYSSRAPLAGEVMEALHQEFPDCAATGRTAAELFQGTELTLPIQVVAPHRIADSPFVQARRLRGHAVYTFRDTPVLNPLSALRHVDDPEEGRAMLEAAYGTRRGRGKFERDSALCGHLSARDRGIVSRSAIGTDSGAEVKVLRRLLEAGLDARANVQVGNYFWDICIPRWKVLVEIDSHRFHTAPVDFIRDRWKNNDAVLRGWITLRYSGSCVTYHLDEVVEQILSARNPVKLAAPVWLWHYVIRRDTAGDIDPKIW